MTTLYVNLSVICAAFLRSVPIDKARVDVLDHIRNLLGQFIIWHALTKLMSRQLLYDETGCETFQIRRHNHNMIKFHEMFHKDAPEYLNSLVPPQIFETHQHNSRRSNNTVYLNCRTFFIIKIETTAHYLLHCPNYIFIRNETIQTLGTIDVQSLIFGNSIKNENENRLVFETVSKYTQWT